MARVRHSNTPTHIHPSLRCGKSERPRKGEGGWMTCIVDCECVAFIQREIFLTFTKKRCRSFVESVLVPLQCWCTLQNVAHFPMWKAIDTKILPSVESDNMPTVYVSARCGAIMASLIERSEMLVVGSCTSMKTLKDDDFSWLFLETIRCSFTLRFFVLGGKFWFECSGKLLHRWQMLTTKHLTTAAPFSCCLLCALFLSHPPSPSLSVAS